MIFDTQDGEGVECVTPRQDDLIDDLIAKLRRAGHTIPEIAKALHWSPRSVYRRLRAARDREDVRDLVETIPLWGADPHWGPDVEDRADQDGKPCRRCGGDMGQIAPGSPFVCLACLRSGLDEMLRRELNAERGRARNAAATNGPDDRRSFAERRFGSRAKYEGC